MMLILPQNRSHDTVSRIDASRQSTATTAKSPTYLSKFVLDDGQRIFFQSLLRLSHPLPVLTEG